MPGWCAFLRAVNVGGTGLLPMSRLTEICLEAGFRSPKTYIASGNVVFSSNAREAEIRAELEARLLKLAGKPIDVAVRSAGELAGVVSANPFAHEPPARVLTLFVPCEMPDDPLAGVKGQADEQIRIGTREVFVFYPLGQGRSKLRLPKLANATSRNMNTVAALAEMAAGLET